MSRLVEYQADKEDLEVRSLGKERVGSKNSWKIRKIESRNLLASNVLVVRIK